jgi:hypothetical protein
MMRPLCLASALRHFLPAPFAFLVHDGGCDGIELKFCLFAVRPISNLHCTS